MKPNVIILIVSLAFIVPLAAGPPTEADRPRLVAQRGHTSPIISVAFTPNGQQLLTVATMEQILWDVASGRELRRFEEFRAILLNDTWLGTYRWADNASFAAEDYYVQLIDIRTGEPGPRFTLDEGQNSVQAMAVSPDGSKLLFGISGGVAVLCEIDSGRELQRFEMHTPPESTGIVQAVAFSPDGTRVMTAARETVLWDVADGRELRRFDNRSSEDFILSFKSLTFSPDGSHVEAWCPTADGYRRYDVETGDELRRMDQPYRVAAVSVDGDRVLTADGVLHSFAANRTVTLFERAPSEPKPNIEAATFSPDGTTVLTVVDNEPGRARLWDTSTGREVRRFKGAPGAALTSVAWSRDGKRIVTGGGDSKAYLWSTETGQELRRFHAQQEPRDAEQIAEEEERIEWGDIYEEVASRTYVEDVDLSPDNRFLVTGGRYGRATLWNLETGSSEHLTAHWGPVRSVSYSPDGRRVATGGDDGVTGFWDAATGQELSYFESRWPVRDVSFSSDGTRILATHSEDSGFTADGEAILWDVETGRQLGRFPADHAESGEITSYASHGVQLEFASVISAALSPDGRWVLTGGRNSGTPRVAYEGSASLWDVETGEELWFRRMEGSADSVAFSPDGRRVLIGSKQRSGGVGMRDAETGEELWWSDLAASEVAFSSDGRHVVTVTSWGSAEARIRDAATGEELARLISFDAQTRIKFDPAQGEHFVDSGSSGEGDGGQNGVSWVVVTPDGRFDTDNLDAVDGVHWIVPDEPLTPLSLEVFMRDYYEPRLLPRILAGETLPPLRDLSRLNRVQPAVSITRVVSHEGDPERVDVHVGVKSTQRTVQSGTVASGAHDLYLFRDGQLVGWQEGDLLAKADGESFERVWEGVRLPMKGDPEVQFSAYAFNADRVKSDTARETYKLPAGLSPRKGRAYIVSVGVNRYDAESWNLKFAVNDARAIQGTVHASLAGLDSYQAVVQVPLYSDEMSRLATKANFQTVIDLLAGNEVDPDLLSQIPNAEEILPARPEDLALFSFSGHGYAGDGTLGERGAFYFLLSDIGESTSVTEDLLARTVSSEELTRWLRGVDAGELALIIDACHSASSVEGEGFKPGPMGSRGLGQLAYNKGMLILAASQADNVAFEDRALKHGFLTYSLALEGLREFMADTEPGDRRISLTEWLDYGVRRVPGLYDEVAFGKHDVLEPNTRGFVRLDRDEGEEAANVPAQQPSLFNFRRARVPLVIGERQAGQFQD